MTWMPLELRRSRQRRVDPVRWLWLGVLLLIVSAFVVGTVVASISDDCGFDVYESKPLCERD
jgi:hypothetical protein